MLNVADRLAIYELLALHGHLMDDGAFDRLDELFTEDFVYDLTPLGFEQLEGADALVRASVALGDANPLGHHVTNPLVVDGDAAEATVRSKGIAVRSDGGAGTVVYEDRVRNTSSGWRIARRRVIPRRRPLHDAEASAWGGPGGALSRASEGVSGGAPVSGRGFRAGRLTAAQAGATLLNMFSERVQPRFYRLSR